jgi:hypothetical protein
MRVVALLGILAIISSCSPVEGTSHSSSIGAQGVTGATGANGAVGPPGATGSAGSPDTPADVLAKLLTVDGAGSGLDADTLGGVTVEQFATIGPRSVPIAISATANFSGTTTYTASTTIRFSDTLDGAIAGSAGLPANFVSGPVRLVVSGAMTGPGSPLTPCSMVIGGRIVVVAREGSPLIPGPPSSPTQVVSSASGFGFAKKIDLTLSVGLAPYDLIQFVFLRSGADSNDTCPPSDVLHLSLEYIGQ